MAGTDLDEDEGEVLDKVENILIQDVPDDKKDDENKSKYRYGHQVAPVLYKRTPRKLPVVVDYIRMKAMIETLVRQRYNPTFSDDQLRAAISTSIDYDRMAKKLIDRRNQQLQLMRENHKQLAEYTDKIAEEIYEAKMASRKDLNELPPMNIPPPIVSFGLNTNVQPSQIQPSAPVFDPTMPPPPFPPSAAFGAPPPEFLGNIAKQLASNVFSQ